MTLFDGVIVVGALAAAVGGYRLGFLARAMSWIGLGLGLYVAARLLITVIDAVNPASPGSRLLTAAIVLVSGAFIGQAIGLLAGARLHRVLPLGPVREIDRGVGAGVGALGVLIGLWLLLPSMAVVPGWPEQTAHRSSIAHWIDSHFPRPPDALQALRRLVGQDAFPQVFNDGTPSGNLGAVPASSGLSATIINRVSGATVKVEGVACDRIQDGSGWVAAPNTIVTNAHVVAGERLGRTRVMLSSGVQLAATVVAFDPERDLAVLHVNRLRELPLATSPGVVGQTGAVFGHPGGQDALTIAPAHIAQNVTAVGQDLYASHQTRRDIYILAANLRPGDSGGPLVNSAGSVIGVAFAIAPDRPGTAYALTAAEARAVLALPHTVPVGTGPCLSD